MYNIKEIKEKLLKYNCRIVNDDEYINISTPLTLEQNGYYTKMYIQNVLNGEKFNIFGTRNPYCVKNMNTYAQRKGIKSEILSVKSVVKSNRHRTLVEVKCGECGKIFTREWTHLKNSSMLCNDCIKKRQAIEQTPKNIEFVKHENQTIRGLDTPVNVYTFTI